MKRMLLIFTAVMGLSRGVQAQWSAQITEAGYNADRSAINIAIKFTQGTEERGEVFQTVSPSTTNIRDFCIRTIERYESLDVFLANVQKNEPIDVQKPAPMDGAKQEFFNNYFKLSRLKQLIAAGTLTGAEKEVTDLEAIVKATYKKEYFDLP